MRNIARHLQASQSEALPTREAEMEKNAAGGFAFKLDKWQRLHRFLIIGTDGGTFYESERRLTIENAANIRECLAEDGLRVVAEALEVSDKALAPKNDQAIFVLACATVWGDLEVRRAAFAALPKVCRIGTHLFQFCEFRQTLGGGWGRLMQNSVSRWYAGKDPADLVHDALKYPGRNGWTHRDVLRLAHPGARRAAR
jgi:60 kDa SS-A/Ro ribonucleoprotein